MNCMQCEIKLNCWAIISNEIEHCGSFIGLKEVYHQIVAIECGIGEVSYPIAQYDHAVVASEHHVEQYMAVPEYKILYIILFDVLFGKLYKRLTLLSSEAFFSLTVIFLSAGR